MTIAVIDTSTAINIKHINAYYILENLKFHLCTTIYVRIELIGDRAIPETKDYFFKLFKNEKIKHIALSIEDLVEMAKIPESRRISDAELSCIVKAKAYGCKAMCDDKKAIGYVSRYIEPGDIIGIKQIIIMAYCESFLGDAQVAEYQKILEKKKFKISGNLSYEAAQKKYQNQ
ncbi:MAG: hypothetical protein AB9917_20045 [Negativicutes bacterium]